MTSPRDVRRELDAVDDADGAGDDGPPVMLISPISDPESGEQARFYYSAETEAWYEPGEVEPDDHMIMELEEPLLRSSSWYDPEKDPRAGAGE